MYSVSDTEIGSRMIVSDTGNPSSTGYAGIVAVMVFVSSIRASNSMPHTVTGVNFFAIPAYPLAYARPLAICAVASLADFFIALDTFF